MVDAGSPGASPKALAGTTVIITGAGRGLGRAYALRFAAEGANVIVAEIDTDSGHATAAEIEASGGRALFVDTDVADRNSVDELVRRTVAAFGRIDVLVNNAAVYDGLHVAPLEALSDDEWDRVMAVNVRGTWYCTRAVIPTMRHQGGGKVVNVGSSSVLAGTPYMLHYVASKGAIEAMTRAMAVELGPFNITVNALVPGLVDSGAVKRIDLPAGTDRPPVRPALARPLSVGAVADAAVFLASSSSDLITGQLLVVNGGSAFG
jgi:3-oxoacyl-[acyl-carrier protein] reductase